jgi:hypothetical protein
VYEESLLGGPRDVGLNIVNGDFGIINEIICVIVVVFDLFVSVAPTAWTSLSPSSSLSLF